MDKPIKRQSKIAVISLVVIIMMVLPYTLYSYSTEPHPQSPTVVTSKGYAREIANGTMSDSSSLFYHTFSLAGYNATYGFSWAGQQSPYLYYNGSVMDTQPMQFTITEIQQSRGFPYFGDFLIDVTAAYVALNVSGKTYYSLNSTGTIFTSHNLLTNVGNSTTSGYTYFYNSPVGFIVAPPYNDTTIQLRHVASYDLTYNLLVWPIIEFGPYYILGKGVWISHTFKFPSPNLRQTFS